MANRTVELTNELLSPVDISVLIYNNGRAEIKQDSSYRNSTIVLGNIQRVQALIDLLTEALKEMEENNANHR